MEKKIVITIQKTELGWNGSIRGKTSAGTTELLKTTGSFSTPEGAIVNLGMKSKTIEKWMEQIG